MTIGSSSFTNVDEEVLEVLEPFVEVGPETTVTQYLDVYSVQGESDDDRIGAHRTLVLEGDEDGEVAVEKVTDGVFQYAVSEGYISYCGVTERVKTGVEVPNIRLTTKGWLVLEAAKTISLTRWDNTIEVESVETEYKVYTIDGEEHMYETIEVPSYVDVSVVFECGLTRIEPSNKTMLVYEKSDDVVQVISVVDE